MSRRRRAVAQNIEEVVEAATIEEAEVKEEKQTMKRWISKKLLIGGTVIGGLILGGIALALKKKDDYPDNESPSEEDYDFTPVDIVPLENESNEA